jgi:hypothetical protein
VEDRWSWTTRDGCSYENVEVFEIDGPEIVINHRFGTSRLGIAELTEGSFQQLTHTELWQSRQAFEPEQNADLQMARSGSKNREENLTAA